MQGSHLSLICIAALVSCRMPSITTPLAPMTDRTACIGQSMNSSPLPCACASFSIRSLTIALALSTDALLPEIITLHCVISSFSMCIPAPVSCLIFSTLWPRLPSTAPTAGLGHSISSFTSFCLGGISLVRIPEEFALEASSLIRSLTSLIASSTEALLPEI